MYNTNMDITEFKTAGEWYKKMKADNFTVPLSLYYALIKLMEDKHITLSTAYEELFNQGQIKIVNKNIIFNLNKNKFKKEAK